MQKGIGIECGPQLGKVTLFQICLCGRLHRSRGNVWT